MALKSHFIMLVDIMGKEFTQGTVRMAPWCEEPHLGSPIARGTLMTGCENILTCHTVDAGCN